MSDQNLPIALFDSGVGGLTVLKAVRRLLPAEDILYLGDTARLPYGAKSPETVIRYTLQCAARLVAMKVKCLVVACNTMSAVGLPALRASYPALPVIGVVEPGAAAACRASVSGRIAVIATESTVRGGAYAAAIRRFRPDAEVRSVSCPLFVPLVEEGWFDGPVVEGIASHYLTPLFSSSPAPDCLVLGCTHYPLLQNTIRKVIGDAPCIVDSADTTAAALEAALGKAGIAAPSGRVGTTRFFTTDDALRFARVGSAFLGRPVSLDAVAEIDL